jgi:hypothetical protein
LSRSSASQITVVGSTSNPNFATDGWAAGDIIYIFDNSSTYYRVIASVSGNTITYVGVDVNPTWANGMSLVLVPNRSILGVSGSPTIVNYIPSTITGFRLVPASTSYDGIDTYNKSTIGNIAIINAYNAVLAWDYLTNVDENSVALPVSAITSNAGYTSYGAVYGYYVIATKCTIGFYIAHSNKARFDGSIADKCTTGYNIQTHSYACALKTITNNTSSTTYSPTVNTLSSDGTYILAS